jgi:hypothetical protein
MSIILFFGKDMSALRLTWATRSVAATEDYPGEVFIREGETGTRPGLVVKAVHA